MCCAAEPCILVRMMSVSTHILSKDSNTEICCRTEQKFRISYFLMNHIDRKYLVEDWTISCRGRLRSHRSNCRLNKDEVFLLEFHTPFQPRMRIHLSDPQGRFLSASKCDETWQSIQICSEKLLTFLISENSK